MNYNQIKVEAAVKTLHSRGYSNAYASNIKGTEKYEVLMEIDLPVDEIEVLEESIKEEFNVECCIFPEKIILVDDEEEDVYETV